MADLAIPFPSSDDPADAPRERFGAAVDSYTKTGARWRVVAFRALRDGDLKVFQRLCAQEPSLLHDRFTKEMEDWELEYESLKWYQFRDTTPLFVASAYARSNIIEWALSNGAETDEKCYMSQIALDVVGNCREDDEEEELAVVAEQLARPLQPPRAPREPRTVMKLTLEEISRLEHFDVPSDDPGAPPTRSTRRVHEQVARAKVTVNWATEWIKPTLEYEFKYRMAKDLRGASDEKWKTETLHSTTKTVTGLMPSTLYAFEVRARNSAGFGALAPKHIIETPDASTMLAKIENK